MEDTELNTTESLELIHKMIRTAKSDISEDGWAYLFWGWLVFIASLLNYTLLLAKNQYHFIGWVILMPLGGIVSALYGRKRDKQQRVRTYVDEFMKYVGISFGAGMIFVILFSGKIGIEIAYPFIMLLYGIFLFTSGGALRFKPLLYGGVFNWACAIASLFLTFEYQLLVLALAVLVGYIIPGHLLKNTKHEVL